MNREKSTTHSLLVGYIVWIFGFLGAHRFYYGRQISGTIYLFTFGLFFIGWLFDLFLIPGMNRDADIRYNEGEVDFNLAWILLTFLGAFGIHRMYMGKWIPGLIYLCTLGGCPKMRFCPNSSELSKNNARNINYMAVLIF